MATRRRRRSGGSGIVFIMRSTFTAPDGTGVASYIADTGQLWEGFSAEVQGNKLHTTDGSICRVVAAADGTFEITFLQQGTPINAAMVRYTDNENRYLLRPNGVNNGYEFMKHAIGVFTVLSTGAFGIVGAWPNPHTVKIKMLGNTFLFGSVNDQVCFTNVIDAFNAAATRVGFSIGAVGYDVDDAKMY